MPDNWQGQSLARRLPWRKGSQGSVEAPDEKSAIAQAAKQFNITPARHNKIAVMRIEERTTTPGRETR
jgi:hypothetical protein